MNITTKTEEIVGKFRKQCVNDYKDSNLRLLKHLSVSDVQKFIRTEFRKGMEELLGDISEYLHHDRDCIESQYEQGRPTENGGYECKIAGKWYQSRPIDETPKCDCGLNTKISEVKE